MWRPPAQLVVMIIRKTDVEYADTGEVVQTPPLLADVVLVSDDDDVLEFAVLVVAGTQRHDEVAQTDQRRLGLGEQTDHDVVAHHRLRRLVTVLPHTRFCYNTESLTNASNTCSHSLLMATLSPLDRPARQ